MRSAGTSHKALTGIIGFDEVTAHAVGAIADRQLRVLIVETTSSASLAPELALRSSGNSVWVAYQVEEATEFMQQARFDVILIDTSPSPLAAIKVATMLRLNEFRWSVATPIIGLVTTPWDTAITDMAFDAVISGHLNADSFVRKINAALDRGAIKPVTDAAAILQRADGDAAFLWVMIQLYEDEMHKSRLAIADALNEGDCEALRFAAHKLKGIVAVFTTGPVPLLQQMETAAAKGETSNLVGMLGPINEQLLQLGTELRQVLNANRTEGNQCIPFVPPGRQHR